MTRDLQVLTVLPLLSLFTFGPIGGGATSTFKASAVDVSKAGYNDDYSSEGCYVDSQKNRIMSERMEEAYRMSAKICFEYCNDGRNTHFGTQHGNQCWCGEDPQLTVNGGKVPYSQCNMPCKRSNRREKCGGLDRMSVYKMTEDDGEDDRRGDGRYDDSYKSKGCYIDSGRNRIMSKRYTRSSMSAEICYSICEAGDYTHFGTQFGRECWCGKNPRLTANGGKVSSSQCRMPCVDSGTRETCGDRDRMSVYEMTRDERKHDDDDDREDKGEDRKDKPYEGKGCYMDSKRNRIMSQKYTRSSMSAKICHTICDDGYYTYFGTQYGNECWCAEDPHLDASGGKVSSRECDMVCAGSRTNEKCGDRDRMSVYKMDSYDDKDDKTPPYKGCYADRTSKRAMPDEKWESNRMTIEMCVAYCSDLRYQYAGSEYGKECWCSDNYDTYGESTRCDMPCAGDPSKTCGGRDALSVYQC